VVINGSFFVLIKQSADRNGAFHCQFWYLLSSRKESVVAR